MATAVALGFDSFCSGERTRLACWRRRPRLRELWIVWKNIWFARS